MIKPFRASQIDIELHQNKMRDVFVKIDEDILKQAFTNLMTNVMKFAVNIIVITLSKDEQNIVIDVDVDVDGCGFAASDEEAIFNEYHIVAVVNYTNKHIGLGLAIVIKEVALHVGKVVAKLSPLLAGARFSIILPNNI